MPAKAPRHPSSKNWIAWLAQNDPVGYPVVGGHSGWAGPIYFATPTDPLVTMQPEVYESDRTVTFHLPTSAVPMTGPDMEMTVVDTATNQDVGLFHFRRDADGTPHADGMARYWLNSEGIADDLGGTAGNFGHRGIPAFEWQFTADEVNAGAIPRRLKCSVPNTAPNQQSYWPMTNGEMRSGVIVEGSVMRIKPGIDVAKRVSGTALVLARNFQRYGILVGDTSGSRTSVKGEMGVSWSSLLPGGYFCLEKFPFSTSWEFLQGGIRP